MGINIPPQLINNIRQGDVILFLGSGASVGAQHPERNSIPIGNRLGYSLNEHFLDGEFNDSSLKKISELAVSVSSITEVQHYIADIFRDFKPADFHLLMPKIPWRMIATTNYDLIVERSYSSVEESIQNIKTFKRNGDRIERKIRSRRDVAYLKLHGCITDIHDPDLPLILTTDQYVEYRKNRSRLFERFKQLAYEYPVVFIGHKLEDTDIRSIIMELDRLAQSRVRSYYVLPSFHRYEIDFWAGKKITAIEGTFESFLREVNSKLQGSFDQLFGIKTNSEHPIEERFTVSQDIKPSEALINFIERDVSYIHNRYPVEVVHPPAFYKGFCEGWGAIDMNLDVHREVGQDISIEVMLADEEDRESQQELFVLKGHAGSGKSVVLKRIAWDAGHDLDLLVLYVKRSGHFDFDALKELYDRCKERIFIFVDSAVENRDLIRELVLQSTRNNIPLTIIASGRYHEWNEYCSDLDQYVDNYYKIDYLRLDEIERLLALLKKHKSLGHLAEKSKAERVEAFRERAGRQLLVALHEATLGKPFEEIVHDEYRSIVTAQARLLYLTVSILNRLRVRVRAGVVSRAHGIPFSEFEESLFRPLEFIVFDSEDQYTGDVYYECRHPHIAQVLFERVLTNAEERFEHYAHILGSLDIDYESDRKAFKGMTNAKELSELFPDEKKVRRLYTIARDRSRNDPNLLQQIAIFEMGLNNLREASRILKRASDIQPWNDRIRHTLAELCLRRSEDSNNDLEREKHLLDSRNVAEGILDRGSNKYAYHTLLKVGLHEIESALNKKDNALIAKRMRDFERVMIDAIGNYPEESFILDAQARYNTIIDMQPLALESLEKAFRVNKRSPYIALRLADTYYELKRLEDAKRVLKKCLQGNQGAKNVHFRLAVYLIKSGGSEPDIEYHLRRSFTKGDSRYEPQFWYARHVYTHGKETEARDIFKSLAAAPADKSLKKKPRGIINKDGENVRFRGSIVSVFASYAFIEVDNFVDDIFVHRRYPHITDPVTLASGTRVSFNLAFTYKGPVAVNLDREEL